MVRNEAKFLPIRSVRVAKHWQTVPDTESDGCQTIRPSDVVRVTTADGRQWVLPNMRMVTSDDGLSRPMQKYDVAAMLERVRRRGVICPAFWLEQIQAETLSRVRGG
jgi:hypothetical protein